MLFSKPSDETAFELEHRIADLFESAAGAADQDRGNRSVPALLHHLVLALIDLVDDFERATGRDAGAVAFHSSSREVAFAHVRGGEPDVWAQGRMFTAPWFAIPAPAPDGDPGNPPARAFSVFVRADLDMRIQWSCLLGSAWPEGVVVDASWKGNEDLVVNVRTLAGDPLGAESDARLAAGEPRGSYFAGWFDDLSKAGAPAAPAEREVQHEADDPVDPEPEYQEPEQDDQGYGEYEEESEYEEEPEFEDEPPYEAPPPPVAPPPPRSQAPQRSAAPPPRPAAPQRPAGPQRPAVPPQAPPPPTHRPASSQRPSTPQGPAAPQRPAPRVPAQPAARDARTPPPTSTPPQARAPLPPGPPRPTPPAGEAPSLPASREISMPPVPQRRAPQSSERTAEPARPPRPAPPEAPIAPSAPPQRPAGSDPRSAPPTRPVRPAAPAETRSAPDAPSGASRPALRPVPPAAKSPAPSPPSRQPSPPARPVAPAPTSRATPPDMPVAPADPRAKPARPTPPAQRPAEDTRRAPGAPRLTPPVSSAARPAQPPPYDDAEDFEHATDDHDDLDASTEPASRGLPVEEVHDGPPVLRAGEPEMEWEDDEGSELEDDVEDANTRRHDLRMSESVGVQRGVSPEVEEEEEEATEYEDESEYGDETEYEEESEYEDEEEDGAEYEYEDEESAGEPAGDAWDPDPTSEITDALVTDSTPDARASGSATTSGEWTLPEWAKPEPTKPPSAKPEPSRPAPLQPHGAAPLRPRATNDEEDSLFDSSHDARPMEHEVPRGSNDRPEWMESRAESINAFATPRPPAPNRPKPPATKPIKPRRTKPEPIGVFETTEHDELEPLETPIDETWIDEREDSDQDVLEEQDVESPLAGDGVERAPLPPPGASTLFDEFPDSAETSDATAATAAGTSRTIRRPVWSDMEQEPRFDWNRWKRDPRVWLGVGLLVLFLAGLWVGARSMAPKPAPGRTPAPIRMLRAIGFGGPRFTVKVTSVPTGARISVDGKATPQRTPADVDVAAGQRRIDLSLPDLGSATFTVKGDRGDRVPLDVNLTGSLQVVSTDVTTPIDVTVDGEPRGFAPIRMTGVNPGAHDLVFAAAGQTPVSQTIRVPIRGEVEVAAKSFDMPASGVMEVRATYTDEEGTEELKGAAVWIDGERRGITPLKLDLPRGPHSVRVQSQDETAPIQVIDLPGGNARYATFAFGVDDTPPRIVIQSPNGPIPRDAPTTVSVSLQGIPAGDVHEMWLHVRTPEGLWRRYAMTMLKGPAGMAGVVVFPTAMLDPKGLAPFYVSALTNTGEEYFTEIQNSRPRSASATTTASR